MATCVKGPRIPEALQQVFLASNRGKEVHKPPPGGLAVKVYKRTWFWQKKSSYTKDINPAAEAKKDKSSKSKDKSKSLFSKKKKKSKGSSTCSGSTCSSTKEGTVKKRKKKKDSSSDESPQIYLCGILESRGYSIEEFNALETGYHNTPTPLQEASYGSHIIDIVRNGNSEELRRLLDTGLSANACNQHGESLIHMASRRGQADCLNVMVEYGAALEIVDDYGRTPLHEAAWSAEPNFEVVEILLQKDIRMLNMLDGRKQTPLSYVRKDIWKPWRKFLKSKVETYWPKRNALEDGPQSPPPLTQKNPNSRKIPTPKSPLSLELAAMVSQGKMDPAEALFLRHEVGGEEDDSSAGGTDLEEGDSDDDSYDSDESDSDFSFDEGEMAMILQSVGGSKSMPFSWKY
mmetsp:Transcript_7906/g.15323  ORF Transcript_7906/g.15323 Transcript_7906/m.15323 type:complete len:403 (-) Transcript_7906:58-1266(-)